PSSPRASHAPAPFPSGETLELAGGRAPVRARMPPPASLPLTRAQRGDPRRPPPHVAGALLVHATGILGFVHAYYILGLRHADGWTGFGTHIHTARFRALCTLGTPLVAECRQLQIRRLAGNLFARDPVEFRQGDTAVYESEQSAVWRSA